MLSWIHSGKFFYLLFNYTDPKPNPCGSYLSGACPPTSWGITDFKFTVKSNMADFTHTVTVKTAVRKPLILGETILQEWHFLGYLYPINLVRRYIQGQKSVRNCEKTALLLFQILPDKITWVSVLQVYLTIIELFIELFEIFLH